MRRVRRLNWEQRSQRIKITENTGNSLNMCMTKIAEGAENTLCTTITKDNGSTEGSQTRGY